MSDNKEQKNDEMLEQATDQLALLFFQLIAEKNKNQIKKVKKEYERKQNTKE